jgi:hypothetical protein
MNNVITIQPERRLCEVDGKLGYFHCWAQYATTVPQIGPLPGGQESHLYEIVEFSKSIRRVNPEDIRFVDEENSNLAAMEEANKVTKEN